jgi:hypothetical protein
MPIEEATQTAQAESVAPQPSLTLDSAAAAWDDGEPETVEAPEASPPPVQKKTPVEAKAEEPEPEEPPLEEEPAEEPDADVQLAGEDVFVEFEGGEKIPVKELKDGYLRQQDYSRKAQETAQERSDLKALGQRFSQTIEQVAGFLLSRLPPEPDPTLVYTNPNLHYQQKMAHDAAYADVVALMQTAEQGKTVAKVLSEADFKSAVTAENDRLIRKMPHLKDPARLEAFNRKVENYAKSAGFTEDEIKTTADHRVRMLVYDAAYGREARAAAARAKGKLTNAAPLLPAKQRQHPNSVQALANVNAVKRLRNTGRLQDAVAIDFE